MRQNNKLPRRTATILAFAAVIASSAVAMAETATLRGTVSYRERMALPPTAALEVKLVDISLADAPAITLAETTVAPAGQVPIAYQLQFDRAAIKPGRAYALQARITVDGQLWFITTTRHEIFGAGPDKTDLLVQRVASDPGPVPTGPVGRWLAEDIRGGGVIDYLQTVLEIAPDGTVSGTGGCNRMSGKAEISGDTITFGPLASTKMACTPAVMDQEDKFFAALSEARRWRVDSTTRKLVLLDANGKPLVVLTRL